MGKNDIVLSPKHGVNPSLGVCFWCGEENGTVILPGKLKGDVEAPRYMCIDYEPCDKCKEQRARGITMIEVKPQQDTTPTGRWVVMREGAFKELFTGPEIEETLKKRVCNCEKELFDTILDMSEKAYE